MTKICYFSGTGNSLWSAKKIAERIGRDCELINIGAEAQKDKIEIEADAVVLLFPAYAYGPPIIVSRFAKRAVFKTNYMAVFVTYGTSPGGALADICRKVRRKNIPALYYGKIPAVENYIAIFGEQKDKTIEKRVLMQKQATEEAANIVIGKKTNNILSFRPFSGFVSALFSLGVRIFYKWYKVGDNCNGCGICKKLCPVDAIVMRNNRPAFTKKCEHCQGCLNWCPQKAIFFARIKAKTKRYHHPEISASEISN